MTATEASLEALVETGILDCPYFHPGGTEVSKELADMCHIAKESYVLDVACGNGATACFLADTYGCRVLGIDATELQIQRANESKARSNLPVDFQLADAYQLPFADNTFDVVISEAILCHLDIGKALTEMTRVTKPGGWVGTHDLCWNENTPEDVKVRFAEVEHERPETLDGWVARFGQAGLTRVRSVEKSQELPRWNKEYSRQLGWLAQVKMFLAILRRWGFAGYRRIRESQRIWEGEHMGYGIVVGVKPSTNADG